MHTLLGQWHRHWGVIMLVAALTALTGVACGGSSGSSGLDPKDAQARAHKAVIKPEDLPGSGWKVAQSDVFEEDTSSGEFDSPECKHQALVWQEILGFRDKLAGRAEVTLTLQGDQPSIEEWVEVYKEPRDAAGLMTKMRDFLGDEAYTCDEQQTVTPDIKMSHPPSTVKTPNNGAVLVQEVTVPKANRTVRREYYYWVQGNVGISLVFTGDARLLPESVVNAAITRAQSRLKDAPK